MNIPSNYGYDLVNELLKFGVISSKDEAMNNPQMANIWEHTGRMQDWDLVLSDQLMDALKSSNVSSFFTASRAVTDDDGNVVKVEENGVQVRNKRGFHSLVVTFSTQEDEDNFVQLALSWGLPEGLIVKVSELSEQNREKVADKLTSYVFGFRSPAEFGVFLTVPSVAVTEEGELAHHGLWGQKRKNSVKKVEFTEEDLAQAEGKTPF